MGTPERNISLGFTEQQFPAGVHVCQIVNGDEEREDAVLKFLLAGLSSGERTSCFSDVITREKVADFLAAHGLAYDESVASEALTQAGVHDIYFPGERFDPERMLQVLADYYAESVAKGFTASRVIGEMSPEVQYIPGGERLLEYESRVSILLRDHPITAVCQYDARLFSGSVIMDILKVHPYIVVRGAVVHNPFHIPPEEFLAN